jgi:hypothetical protein
MRLLLPPIYFLIGATISIASGCAPVQLRNTTLRQARTVEQLQQQQVLDNLAMFFHDINSMPYFVWPQNGTDQVTNQNQISDVTTFQRAAPPGISGWVSSTLSPLRSHSVQATWQLNAVNDPHRLQLMRCAYQQVVRACLAQCTNPHAQGGDLCPDCQKLFNEFYTGNPDVAVPPPGSPEDPGAITNLCLGGHCDWLAWGKKKPSPREYEMLGHYRDTWVWVVPGGRDELAKLTLAILDYAVSTKLALTKEIDIEVDVTTGSDSKPSASPLPPVGQPLLPNPPPAAPTPDPTATPKVAPTSKLTIKATVPFDMPYAQVIPPDIKQQAVAILQQRIDQTKKSRNKALTLYAMRTLPDLKTMKTKLVDEVNGQVRNHLDSKTQKQINETLKEFDDQATQLRSRLLESPTNEPANIKLARQAQTDALLDNLQTRFEEAIANSVLAAGTPSANSSGLLPNSHPKFESEEDANQALRVKEEANVLAQPYDKQLVDDQRKIDALNAPPVATALRGPSLDEISAGSANIRSIILQSQPPPTPIRPR